jgi:toxin YoeB
MYNISYTTNSLEDLKYFRKSNPALYKRARKLLEDIQKHPTIGIGKPEKLVLNLAGCWSRRVSREHRIVYTIQKNEIKILQARYHY